MKHTSSKNLQNNIATNINTEFSGDIFSKHAMMLGRNITDFKDLYSQKTTFSDGKIIECFPHLMGVADDQLKIIPYNNDDGMNQEKLIEMMGDRRILISIKHHAIDPLEKESLKLQCTHAQLIVKSSEGVMSLNNPQSYEQALFGDKDYPMMFFSIDFPEEVSKESIRDYENNIILWTTIINTFSSFPSNYDGGDPLSAKDRDSSIRFADMAMKALAGNSEARSWFKEERNKLYCAELVFLGLTLGLIYPLNERHLDSESFNLLRDQLHSKEFLCFNSNPLISHIDLPLPSSDLCPLEGNNESTYFGSNLAVRPMLVSDMLTSYIKYTVDRENLGEKSGRYQLELFKYTQRFLNQYLPVEAFSENSSVSLLITKVEEIILKEHDSYKDYLSKLKPVLRSLNEEVSKYSNSKNTFIPPHCFFVRSLEYELENKRKGLVGIKYFGHGIHKSLL